MKAGTFVVVIAVLAVIGAVVLVLRPAAAPVPAPAVATAVPTPPIAAAPDVAAVLPPLKERTAIATISPKYQWRVMRDANAFFRTPPSPDVQLTPETFRSVRLVAQPLDGENGKGEKDWYMLLCSDPASVVDGALVQPGQIVTRAYVRDGSAYLSIELPPSLGQQLGSITKDAGNMRLAFVIDGNVLMAPNVVTPLGPTLGTVPMRSQAEADWIAARIRSHPASMRLQRVVQVDELADEEALRGDFRSGAGK